MGKLIWSVCCLVSIVGFCVVSETEYQEIRVVQEVESPRIKGMLSKALIKTDNKRVIVQNGY